MSFRSAGALVVISLLAMCGGGCSQIREAGDTSQRLIDFLTGRTARVAAVKMEDQNFPDERRQGINLLVDRSFGTRAPYTDRYAQIAQSDSDYLVRATAIRALNRSRDKTKTPLFIKALDDQSELVRLEGAKALTNMPDPSAAPALVKLINNPNENKDVRIAAAEAMKHYRNFEVARALIAQLGGRDFGVAWQAHNSLINITGKDLRYDEAAWLNYVRGPEKPLG